MASLEELRAERLKKLEQLRSQGINPYPIEICRESDLATVRKNFSRLSKRKKPVVLAGRIKSLRSQGSLTFFNLDDGTDNFQALIKKDEVVETDFKNFEDLVDLGDFIEVSGSLFLTKRDEQTLLVKNWRFLGKALRPLPDKWHGLADVEERFRRRYLDSLMSGEIKDRFLLRSKIITAIRNFLNKEQFVEVETPMLQPLAGGALANPFGTYHEALDLNLYLRIAPEIYLKEMLVGGFPKVYELGRSFRNEGIDVTHNPEFTSLEAYAAYSTPKEQRGLIAKMFRSVIKEVVGSLEIKFDGQLVNFSSEIPVITFSDLLKKYTLINDYNLSEKELAIKASQFGINLPPNLSKEKIIDHIYKKVCRPKLIQPIWIVDYPVAFSPLAKRKDDNPELIDRFQLVAGGLELINGFAELNNPLDQAERFAEQEAKKEAGDEEAQSADASYVEALEYGLPPATGWGMGIDRLIMLLTDTHNIREVIFFPTMRPR